MFCTNCGSAVQDSANFCTACSSAIQHAPAPPPPAPIERAQTIQPPPRPVEPIEASSSPASCPWCGAQIDPHEVTSCPRCGASVRAPQIRSESGWRELPGRKDMAKLQFGQSFCQIEGIYVPVADVNLAGADSIYFTHHVLLWKDLQVNMTTMSLASGWKRLFAGLPLIMMQAHGPGHIALSRDAPGEMIALPLQPGEEVDVREHLFMLATANVAYDWFSTNIWYTTRAGDDQETHYPVGMFMDRFSAPQAPGLLILHAAGNVFVRELGPGETLLVKPTALIFKDPSVQMQLHFEHPRTGFSVASAFSFNMGSFNWSNRYYWLRLYGPGRVAVQSVFDRMEGENRYLANCSPATEQRW